MTPVLHVGLHVNLRAVRLGVLGSVSSAWNSRLLLLEFSVNGVQRVEGSGLRG